LVSGNYPKATEELTKAIEILESLRPGLSDANKVAIFDTQDHTYRALQKALVAENKIEEALEIAERGRARAYVELLAKRISKTSDIPKDIAPPKIKEIQQIARDQKATLVEYSIISDKELFIWVVQPTGKISFRKANTQQLNTSLEDFFVDSRRLIGVKVRGIGAVPIDPKKTPSQATLQKWHQILIEPIADLLPTNPESRVIILPHKSLFLIPFAALQDTSDKYLIEKHTLITAPAIQVLEFTRKQRREVSGKGALVVGNPKIEAQVKRDYKIEQIDGAEREAIKIARILNTKPLIGRQATKATVLQQMLSARIIHLATHGLLDDVKKLGIPGAIVLAPENKDNGLLTTSEILGLKRKLNAELAVLSACDTGRGKLTGDGVIDHCWCA
jgi:CHAT domain-containing protein